MITDYKRAATIEEALSLAKEGYVFLAGGTQVNNAPFRKWGKKVTRVVSLDGLKLTGIDQKGDGVHVGAGVTLQELADSSGIPTALKVAAGFIPTRSVRNIATIGGNVGARRPDSYLIPALIALGAVAETPAGTVPVEEYLHADKDDLILAFRIPKLEGACRAVKESRSHIALPVVSAAVRIVASGSGVTDAVVAVGCVGPRTVRLTDVEAGIVAGGLLEGEKLEGAISKSVTPVSDFLGSREYKRYVNSVVIADCVRACIEEAAK